MYSETQIKSIADMLLPGFIPKDGQLKEFSFHFTIPPNHTYKVNYKKNHTDKWELNSYEKVDSNAG
ncbi:hypothetical protein ABIE26_004978 [Pedobacter africanus]|uniref:Uncharacterized protein n=1 Tax=Pedobacter africanus TaxID=151894 RepID=A0ACC6L441_9SPHI|nr:hypothetical protein [Pedobacter africanus]MDR6786259.1 hypothetical protein [Pedobacter africanus]